MTVHEEILEESRAKRLRAASTALHEQVDAAVMAAAPFADLGNYARFLRFQYRLHRQVAPLYAAPFLQPILPGLAERERLSAVERDFADLGVPLPELAHEIPILPTPEALGWLYVVEGSNMGAAFLLKAASRIDLSEAFGARHLAAHGEGRGLHWRRFTQALDAISLTPIEDLRAEAAAVGAFGYVLNLVRDELA
ncbi:biliverdin-producing heme oxygenase [Xanthobacter sp. DSM 24535]|uniref:biliverdin-producing heme oxygenase n=1 Tax=Roseixanthobacter psychrophilus TaxID=3119917 RepID=UPI00372C0420